MTDLEPSAAYQGGFAAVARTRLLYRVEEAAELLACSPRTLRELHKAGRIQAVTHGAELRFADADLRAYVERLRREAEALRQRPARRLRSL